MENLKYKFEQLNEKYNTNEESKRLIQNLKNENIELGKKLAVLYNVVEISNYINSFISKKNIVQLINDMIMGVLGVTYSTIFLMDNDLLRIKVTNINEDLAEIEKENEEYLKSGSAFIKNYNSNSNIRSKMGIPIQLGDKLIGYIIVEHTHENYFTNEHKLFITTIANQVAIAIENSALYRKLEDAAQIDSLMGIYNRRSFFNQVEQKIVSNKNYAIIMLDFDNFKKINDTFGHQFGDEVLVKTCNLIKHNLKDTDIIGRYGGEELIIYVDNVENFELLYKKIDSVRKQIMNNSIEKDGKYLKATTSIGVSLCDNLQLNEVIKRADEMLYKAKRAGKNKVIAYRNI